MNTQNDNWNILWSKWVVEELVRNGICFFCISPGSRSTPLTTAVAENKQTQSKIIIDERAAAYFALGRSRATGCATVLISTSGTAVANYLPAIVEASVDHVPMLILTADRPPELHNCGANQTIKQNHIFGNYVRWFYNPGCPCPDMPVEALLSMVDYAVQCTQTPTPGPVHLNFPFREPLLSDFDEIHTQLSTQTPVSWQFSNAPYIYSMPAKKSPDSTAIDNLLKNKPKRGILSVGRVGVAALSSIKRLAQALNWPLFADIASGLRLGTDCPERIAHYGSLLKAVEGEKIWQPDAIWHLGFPPLDQGWMKSWGKGNVQQMVWITDHSVHHDPGHCFTWRLESDFSIFCEVIAAQLPSSSPPSSWLKNWQSLDTKTEALMTRYLAKANPDNPVPSEAHIAHLLSQRVPPEHGLFIGNSLPVRMIDSYGSRKGTTAPIALNRQASGIDGLIASAAGYAQGLQRPVTLLIGDLSFLHDLNSLALLERSTFPVYIVLCNNHGGGIFSFLPIAKQRCAIFEPFFGTPHKHTFASASQLFNLDYYAVNSLSAFTKYYLQAISQKRSTIIEVATERSANVIEQERWQNFFLQNLQSEKSLNS